LRKLSAKKQTAYVRAVANFTRFLGRSPDRADAEDLRRYQLHLVEQGVSSITLNATITGLKFFFEVTPDRAEAMKKMRHVYEPRKLPEVLSLEEVTRLLHAAGSLKYQAALGVAYGAGLRASEVVHLKVSGIDGQRRAWPRCTFCSNAWRACCRSSPSSNSLMVPFNPSNSRSFSCRVS
jgi:site-specific recombinase XerD